MRLIRHEKMAHMSIFSMREEENRILQSKFPKSSKEVLKLYQFLSVEHQLEFMEVVSGRKKYEAGNMFRDTATLDSL